MFQQRVFVCLSHILQSFGVSGSRVGGAGGAGVGHWQSRTSGLCVVLLLGKYRAGHRMEAANKSCSGLGLTLTLVRGHYIQPRISYSFTCPLFFLLIN